MKKTEQFFGVWVGEWKRQVTEIMPSCYAKHFIKNIYLKVETVDGGTLKNNEVIMQK